MTAHGVRVGPKARFPRLPALYSRKNCRLPDQRNPMDYLDEHGGGEGVWQRRFSSVAALADKVVAVH